MVNKIDIDDSDKKYQLQKDLMLVAGEILHFISAKQGTGLDELRNLLGKVVDSDKLISDDVIISNVRHYEALRQVLSSLERVSTGLDSGIPSDLIATDIRHAIHHLGEITGEITSDEILENIFKNFCIGK